MSRKLRMFSSQVEYVELSVTNYRLSTGKIKLPQEFGMANDKKLRDQISAQMTSPFKVIGPQTIKLLLLWLPPMVQELSSLLDM